MTTENQQQSGPLSQGLSLGSAGWFCAAVNKSSDVSLRLCLLPQLSLSHTVAGSLFRPFMNVPILWDEGGQDCCPCWAHLTPPGLTMDELVLLYQHLFLSRLTPLFFFFFDCRFNHFPLGQSATGRAGLCAAVFVCVRHRWFCAADRRVPWLTLTLRLVSGSLYYSLILGLRASLPILMCALLMLCIHEMQIRYLSPRRINTASSAFCAYILTSLCERRAVVYSWAYFRAGILPARAEGAADFSHWNSVPFLNLWDQQTHVSYEVPVGDFCFIVIYSSDNFKLFGDVRHCRNISLW